MALIDLYELVVKTVTLGETALNVYHALRPTASFDAAQVAQAFVDSTIAEQKVFTNATVTFEDVTVTSLGDPTDFAIHNLGSAPGLGGGEALPCHDCYKVQFLRKRTDMRHGWKRLPGVGELNQIGGVPFSSTVTTINTWAAALMANWEEAASPGIQVANFVIVKRVKYVDPIDGKTKYRMPETDGELITYQPDSNQVGNVSTQSTRKK